MVIIGYQGIGKTTLARHQQRFIDLESSCFKYGDPPVRDENWYQPYCNMAINLSNCGRYVFVSSHREVREYLVKASLKQNIDVMAIAPAKSLKDAWIAKLQARYNETHLEKDRFALLNALDCYDANTTDILNCGVFAISIDDINYHLPDICFEGYRHFKSMEAN